MNEQETTQIPIDLQLDAFEKLVFLMSQLTVPLQEYAYVGVFLSGLSIVLAWSIFRYHEHRIEDYEFFKANIHVVGRFTGKTFEMFRWWSKTFPPLAVFVVVFSIWTRFDTLAFIRMFGIKHVRDS